MAGIITVPVIFFNGKEVNENKGISVDLIVRVRPSIDGSISYIQTVNNTSLNMNEYVVDLTSNVIKALIDAAGTDNAIQFPFIPIYREETAGGSQNFNFPVLYILNKGHFLDVTNTIENGVVTGTVIQYQNNLNDYFAVLYTADNLLATSGNGQPLGV